MTAEDDLPPDSAEPELRDEPAALDDEAGFDDEPGLDHDARTDDGGDPSGDGDSDEPTERRPVSRARVVAGAICLVIGLIAVVAAVQAASDDSSGNQAVETARGSDEDPTPTTGGDDASPKDGEEPAAPAPGWPATVQGRPLALGTDGPPPADVGDLAPGWYLWSDFHDWHLWLVGGEGTDASAVVTTNSQLTVKDTFGEADVESTEDAAVIRAGTGAISGIDFNPGFYGDELTITVTGDLPLRTGQQAVDAASPLALRYERKG